MKITILCPRCGWKAFEMENPENTPFEITFPCPRCFGGPRLVYGDRERIAGAPPARDEEYLEEIKREQASGGEARTLGFIDPAPLQEEKPAA